MDECPEFLYNAAFRLLAALGRLVIVNLPIKAAPSNRAAAADRIVRFVGIALAHVGVALARGHPLNGISITTPMQKGWFKRDGTGSERLHAGPEPAKTGSNWRELAHLGRAEIRLKQTIISLFQ